jgi:hypothetical protein
LEQIKNRQDSLLLKSITPFFVLDNFYPNEKSCGDSMHFLFEGCICQIFNEWKTKYFNINTIKTIEKNINAYKLPRFISRIIQPLNKLANFNALDYVIYSLYLRKVFKPFLPNEIYNHFNELMVIIENFMEISIPLNKLNENKLKILKLIKDIDKLYGEKSNGFNFHLLYHISDFVYWFGPIFLNNLFPYEGKFVLFN